MAIISDMIREIREQKEKIAVLEEENKSQKEKIAVLEEEARQGRAKERTWTKGQEDYHVAVWGKEQEPKEPDRLAEMVRRRPWRYNNDTPGEFNSCDCGDDYAICQDCNSPKCTCCGLCECSFGTTNK
tara:strand:- start:363 stop:746 length:384 start_codon:yes stop_codon:yes gene_type:complete